MARNWISFPRRAGEAPKQAHTGIPEGVYERELGKEGFFGPATQMYHAHRPTDWSAWEGELRPRALDLNLLDRASASPWEADPILGNASLAGKMKIYDAPVFDFGADMSVELPTASGGKERSINVRPGTSSVRDRRPGRRSSRR